MTDILVEFVLHGVLFVAVCAVVFYVFREMETAVAELESRNIDLSELGFAELYLNLSSRTFFLIRLVVAGVFFAVGFIILDVITGLILGLLGYALPWFYLRGLKKKRILRIEQQLVEGLELLGNGLKSGLTLQQACELLVKEFPPPISQEFSMLLAETRLGVDFTDALQNMADRLDSNIIHILASGVSITKRCGGDLTQIFTNIATTIREQANIEGKLNAVTAQGRFQGLVLGLMPFVLVVILYFIDPAHVKTLFGYQIGLYAFSGVVVMVILAQVWIHKLLDIDV